MFFRDCFVGPSAFLAMTVGFILTFSQATYAETLESDFFEGNRLYSEGKYVEAVEKYQLALQSDKLSSALYFNLGNSYYKLKDLGNAVLFYHRALKWAPRDEELKYNLRLVESQLRDSIPPKQINVLARTYWGFVDQWTEKELVRLFFIFYFAIVFIALLQLFWVAARKNQSPLLIVFLLFWGLFISFLVGKSVQANVSHAVVMEQEVQARYGPSDQDVAAFTLHVGTTCRILGSSEEWFQIRLADGKVAWLPNTSVEPI